MEKTVNEEVFDALVRHQIYLMRYSSYVRNKINSIVSASEGELSLRLRAHLERWPGLSSPVEWQRLQVLQTTLKGIRQEAWKEASAFLQKEMIALVYQEPIQIDNIYRGLAPVVIKTVMPETRMLKAIALSRPFEGRILKDWASNMASEDIRRISGAIQGGMVAGEGMGQIVSRVIGTEGLKYTDGVTEMSRRQVESVTRTAVQHVANASRNAYFEENADVITAEQYVSTLDARTTAICRSLDGKVFELGKGPKPPLHFGCRSLRIAAIDGVLAGDRPAKPTTEKTLLKEYSDKNKLTGVTDREDLPRGKKGDYDEWARGRIREMTGPIPASTNYQTWLTRQSKDFQDEVLGKTKAQLFRDGGLTLDKFVHRNGDELTLKELASKHKDAFKSAGLNPDNFK